MKEYLALSFSYMSFLIKDKIEIEDIYQKGNVFDPEPYNYVFNRSTCFLDSADSSMNYQEMVNVLQNFYKIDPDLLG